MQPRLELRREDQVHEDERQRDREQEAHRGPVQLARAADRTACGIPRRHPRLPAAAAICSCVAALRGPGQQVRDDGDLALAADPVDRRRARRRARADHVVERDDAERVRRHRQAGSGRAGSPRCCSRAHAHVVLLAALVVGRHLIAADEQRAASRRRRPPRRRDRRRSRSRRASTAPACRRRARCRRRPRRGSPPPCAARAHALKLARAGEVRALDHVLDGAAAHRRGRRRLCTAVRRLGVLELRRGSSSRTSAHHRDLVALAASSGRQPHVDAGDVLRPGGRRRPTVTRVKSTSGMRANVARHALGDEVRRRRGSCPRARAGSPRTAPVVVRAGSRRGAVANAARASSSISTVATATTAAVAHRPASSRHVGALDRP